MTDDTPEFFDIYKWRGRRLELVENDVSLAKASELTEIDDRDIEWAIEETGRCDVGRYVVVPTGERVEDGR